MISSRSYKNSYTVAYALGELERNSSTQFDPRLAEIFVRLVKSGEVNPITGSDDVAYPQPSAGTTSVAKAAGQSR